MGSFSFWSLWFYMESNETPHVETDALFKEVDTVGRLKDNLRKNSRCRFFLVKYVIKINNIDDYHTVEVFIILRFGKKKSLSE